MEKIRERENIKIIGPFRSYTTSNRKFQKNSKKIQKVKKYHYGLISSQNRLEKNEKERKYTIMPLFQAKIGWKMLRKREYKNYRSVPFLHDE